MRALREGEFERVFAIMQASFPTAEYRPYRAQHALLKDPRYRIFVEGEVPVYAFLATWELKNILFVEHFAVDPAYRGQGIGTQMLRELRARYDAPLCLEVELPHTEQARRRIAFYERAGFCCNTYPYEQPPMARGKAAVPLLLMTTGGGVSEERFIAIRDTLYREVYGR